MQRVHVIPATALAHGFDYLVPEGMELEVGTVVLVPLAGREVVGVVAGAARDDVPEGKMKPVRAAFTQRPAFSEVFMKYLIWVADYTLAPLGAVVRMALPVPRAFTHPPKTPYLVPEMRPNLSVLSEAQKAIVDNIISLTEHVHETFVLDGVTGSGKTELYYGVMEAHLSRKNGAQILVLLPEIALTHQWLSRFEKSFGFTPVVWHSGISDAARRRGYNAVMDGSARVVVGARSALFLPFAQLSLIVVDEEHEPSYKQEEGVSYHARDMAVVRGAMERVPVLLVSATPSLETQANAQSGKYTTLHLPVRHGGAALPEVSLIDMRAEALERGAFISPSLRTAMLDALSRGEQSLLFLNRRGYAPLMLCRACGHRFQCSQCSAWLVLHKGKKKLQCHHCGHSEPEPKDCPACKAENALVSCGPGVERIEEEVRALLPEARVALLSSDATVSAEEIEAIIAGERDIIIGTQMVAKGHHFPKLSTVGVIDADLGLQGGDLRASERAFQLLHQLSGRAGREAISGHVYLQTYQPEHPVMQALAAADGDAFYALEREGRKLANWPPYGQLASLLFDGANESEVRSIAQRVAQAAPRDGRIRVLGPAPAALSRLKGQYRYRILVKTERGIHLQQLLSGWIADVTIPRSVRVKMDVNPYSFV